MRAIADGRIMTGRQALAAGLVDAIGGEAEARAHLAAAHAIPADLPVRDLQARDLRERAFGASWGASLAESFGAGLGTALGAALKSVVSEGLGHWLPIDGARALWQPSRS